MWSMVMRMLNLAILLSGLIVWWKNKRKYAVLENEMNKYKTQFDIMCQWLRNHTTGEKLVDLIKERGIKNVAIYGKGNIGRLIFRELEGTDIVPLYFVDRNAGRIVEDLIKTISIDEINDEVKPDAILVSLPYDFLNIRKELEEKIQDNIRIISIEELVYKI